MSDESRLMICPLCGREASVANWNSRPICVHSWSGSGGTPEIWDGDDVDGEGRKIEESPNENFRVPGPTTWAQMLPRHGVLTRGEGWMSHSERFGHRWYWRNGAPRQRSALDRKGQRCRPLVRGSNGNLLIEFEDGYRTVAPRHAIRRATSCS